jgi:hypothetical protein
VAVVEVEATLVAVVEVEVMVKKCNGNEYIAY